MQQPGRRSGTSNWVDFSSRFAGERDCCAAYLALQGAEVIQGEKPGNLVNLVNRKRPCGTNPYLLWRRHGSTVLEGTGLSAFEVADRGDSLLLYLYREDLLRKVLAGKAVRIILGRLGYTGSDEPAAYLQRLAHRTADGSFPHEIGIFLGYPLKDVLAFMGEIRLAYTCQGPWKIFGNPDPSLKLAERFRECRCRMAERLSCCGDPRTCLVATPLREEEAASAA